jgi:hypothetical protein
MVRGYGHRRYRTAPDRDVYAVAEAVVASALWVAIVWLATILMGDPVKGWGLVPLKPGELGDHRAGVLGLVFGVIAAPYGVGAAAAALVDRLEQDSPRFVKFGRKLGFLRNPTAWDRAWLGFAQDGPGRVSVRLKDGSLIKGTWAEGGQVDLSPSPYHHLLIVDGYLEEAGTAQSSVEDSGVEDAQVIVRAEANFGVFVQGDEIAAVFFHRDEGPTAPNTGDTETPVDEA